jgi:hypothetical protein
MDEAAYAEIDLADEAEPNLKMAKKYVLDKEASG